MIRNYLKIAWRSLLRNKVFSFINIIGLALGLAVSMLILLFVSHEVSYDKFHEQHENIFQVQALAKMGDMEFRIFNMSASLGDAIMQASPSVKDVGRKSEESEVTFETDPKHRYNETGFLFVDEGFFRIFNFKILEGDVASLKRPYTIMLTPEMALKYFGKANPIGKTIKWNKKTNLEVTGIVQKNPSNSSIQYNFIGSLPTVVAVKRIENPGYWTTEMLNKVGAGYTETFLRLDNAQNQPNVAKVLNKVTAQNPDNEHFQFSIQGFSSSYLGANTNAISDRAKYVYIFSGIAFLILVLALINFMNLTTARATTRAKEVGVRKSVGANKWGLAIQFYAEATLTILISLIFGIILFKIIQPFFYQILELKIDDSFLLNPYFYISSIIIFTITLFLAGSYPTFILSKYNPAEVLKGKVQTNGNLGVRQTLTVFQLAVSVGLIFCSIVIFSQIKQMRTKNIGLNKDQMLIITLDPKSKAKNQALINQIEQIKGVKGVSGSQHRMFFQNYNMITISKAGEKDPSKSVGTIVLPVDEKFADLYQMQWKMKPAVFPTDLNDKIILNESAAKKIDPNFAAIKAIDMGYPTPTEVIGIVKDFNFISSKHNVQPMMLQMVTNPQSFDFLNIKIDKNIELPTLLQTVEQAYNTYKTEDAFTYHFADDTFNKLFKSEDHLANIFGAFTGIAIFIACLGLFGLITFMAEQRNKEIGIRKVLGASVFNITAMLSKGFMKLVVIAIFIAIPIAYYAMNKWLDDFVYRINIQWWMFVVGGLGIMLITLLTVSYQSIKAALMNPVKSLKTE